jgi:GntR family transcriptional repressor for pyruvate dehydrogenase complex
MPRVAPKRSQNGVSPNAGGAAGNSLADSGQAIRRVRKAYEQVADQLRELIHSGIMVPGERLPNEQALAADFGVSRATVREALRVLSTENLLRTAKGAAGGSYVTRPSMDHISEFLRANISLMSQSEDVTLEEFLEAREYLEVPAARLAAVRRTDEDIEQLVLTIPDRPQALAIEEQFSYNRDFHSRLVQLSGNTLLRIATQPVFSVLQHNLARSTLGRPVHQRINDDHRKIAEAIRSGDPDVAEQEMRQHLSFLRPQYERAWKYARKRS